MSLLGLAIAGAALVAGPGRAQTLDLNGVTVARVDFGVFDTIQNGLLQLTNDNTLTFAGTLRDNGGNGGVFSLQKFGTGTLNLSGSNSYSGGTVVSAGTLGVGSSSALGSGSLTLASATLTALIDSLSLTNSITVISSNIDTGGFNLALTGPIAGSSFTKFGPGTLTLSGTIR